MTRPQFELNPEQTQAIDTPGSLAVRAGAGSGKTEVLARRFVALIAGTTPGRERLMPDRIAALTFTEKATRDMRARIATVLDEECERCADEELAAHLRRARRFLPLARISTIHSFCARVLRENPLEGGLAANFQVLDDYESKALLERHVRELILMAVRRGHPGALRMVQERGLRGSSFYRPGAIDLAINLIGNLQRTGKDYEWLLKATEDTCAALRREGDGVRKKAAELTELVYQLLQVRNLVGDAASDITELKRHWPQIRKNVSRFDAEASVVELEHFRILSEKLPDAKAHAIKPLVIKIRELIEKADSRLGLRGSLIEAYGAQRAITAMHDSADLVAAIAKEIEAIKRQNGLVTFDDLLIGTRNLLRDRIEVARRYREKLAALLIDEYQDTDPTQGEIVSLLTGEREGLARIELFVVGDEKQSIYRFRGADVTVFKKAQREVERRLSLHQNRRAGANLIAFTNAFSAIAMRAKTSPAPEFWVEWDAEQELEPFRPDIGGDQPSVEVLLRATSKKVEREQEARSVAIRIAELVGTPVEAQTESANKGSATTTRPAQFGDVALLMRSFQDVRMYEQALSEAGIPFYVVSGRGFFERVEVLDLIELLTAVEDEDNSLALAAALRSPFFGLSDLCLTDIALLAQRSNGSVSSLFRSSTDPFTHLAAEREEATNAWRVLRELRSMRGVQPIAAIIERALQLTDLTAVLAGQGNGRQRIANMQKLKEMVRGFEERHLDSNLIAYLKRLTSEPPLEASAQVWDETQNVVRVMTVHQAKGLEFPIVVLADMGRAAPREETSYLLSPTDGLLLCATVGSGDDEIPHSRIREYRLLLAEQERAESARLLYVAITRARDRLVLSSGSRDGAWRKKLIDFLEKETVDGFLRSGELSRPARIGGAEVLLRHPAETITAITHPGNGVLRRADQNLRELAEKRLSFSAPAPTELVISPTKLADFERCPRQYELRHELHLAETDGAIGGDGEGALAQGIITHAVLQSLDLKKKGEELRRQIDRLIQLRTGELTLDRAVRESMSREIFRYVSGRSGGEEVRAREVPFFARVGDNRFKVFIRGQIDALVQDLIALTIRDYKYAKYEEGREQNYQLQMDCYAVAVRESHPERQIRAEVVFLRSEARAQEIHLREDSQVRAELVEMGRSIVEARASGVYPKKPAGAEQCRKLGCGYVRRCWYGDAAREARV